MKFWLGCLIEYSLFFFIEFFRKVLVLEYCQYISKWKSIEVLVNQYIFLDVLNIGTDYFKKVLVHTLDFVMKGFIFPFFGTNIQRIREKIRYYAQRNGLHKYVHVCKVIAKHQCKWVSFSRKILKQFIFFIWLRNFTVWL